MDFEDESTRLLHRVLRLRTIQRYVKDPRGESGLRELIAEAEQRLEQLEAMRRPKASMRSSPTWWPVGKTKAPALPGLTARTTLRPALQMSRSLLLYPLPLRMRMKFSKHDFVPAAASSSNETLRLASFEHLDWC
jgi:transposase